MVASLRVALHARPRPPVRVRFHHLQMVASLRVDSIDEWLVRADVSTISRWWLH